MNLRGLALAALLAIPGAARAMTPEDQAAVTKGIDALYMCDYDGAEQDFAVLMAQRPGDPVLSLGYATATWWRMENLLALPGSPEEARFTAAVSTAIADASSYARGHAKDPEAYLYLGAAYGLRGRWEAARQKWVRAYFDGRRAYKAERRAVSLDPALDDAYLGLGAFDYYLATLSRIVRFLAFMGGGGKARGLHELALASQGRFSAMAAKLLLVAIDWTFEKKPQEAWQILEDAGKRYPGSPFFAFLRLVGLVRLGDAQGLGEQARRYLDHARAKAPFYRPLDRAIGRGFLGLARQMEGRPQEALVDYERAAQFVPRGQRFCSVLSLFKGESLDLLGRRADARDAYRQALRQPPLWGVQRYAHYLLAHPFRPGDNPLPARSDKIGT